MRKVDGISDVNRIVRLNPWENLPAAIKMEDFYR